MADKLTGAQARFLSRFVARGWLHGTRDDADEQGAIDAGLRCKYLRRELSEVVLTPLGRSALSQSHSDTEEK